MFASKEFNLYWVKIKNEGFKNASCKNQEHNESSKLWCPVLQLLSTPDLNGREGEAKLEWFLEPQ